jgi:hypothetical protein
MQQESQIRAFAPPSLVPRHVPLESPKAANAYGLYESMGPERSLAKLAKALGKPSGYARYLEEWSSRYNWQQRIADYERQQLEERRKKRQAEIDKMDEEHAIIGRGNLLRAVELVRRHIDTQDTTLASAVSLLKASYELERLARGAATERFEGDVGLTILPKMYINLDPNEEGSEP